jgi:hypothetical protein
MESLQIILEGRNNVHDKSYLWCSENEDLRSLEQRIRLTNFMSEVKQRQLDTEYRILERITKTNKHTDHLAKYDVKTRELNRYRTILPFDFNIPYLGKSPEVTYDEPDQ